MLKLVKKLRTTGPEIIFLIFVVALVTWIGAFIQPQPLSEAGFDIEPMPFFDLLLSVVGFNHLLSTITAFVLLLFLSFLLVNLNTNLFFISERTFLPAILYVSITGLYTDQQILNPVIPAALFLILAMKKIMDSYQVHGTAYSFFDAGMLISIGSLFYASLIWFGILLIAGLVILRTGAIKEFAITIIGMITPLFIVYGIYYVTGSDMNNLLSAVAYNLFEREPEYIMPGYLVIISIISSIVIFVCLFHLLSAINTKKIKSRKTFTLLFWIFLIAITLYLIFGSVSIEIIWIAAIPAVYIISHYFVFARSRIIPEVLLMTIIIMMIVVQVVRYL